MGVIGAQVNIPYTDGMGSMYTPPIFNMQDFNSRYDVPLLGATHVRCKEFELLDKDPGALFHCSLKDLITAIGQTFPKR